MLLHTRIQYDIHPRVPTVCQWYAELMSYFARHVWRKIWETIAPKRQSLLTQDQESVQDNSCLPSTYDALCMPEDECSAERRLGLLDSDRDGSISADDIQTGYEILLDYLYTRMKPPWQSLAQFVQYFLQIQLALGSFRTSRHFVRKSAFVLHS
jgi:hypothetical protein